MTSARTTIPPLAPGGLPGFGHAIQLLRDPIEFFSALNDVAPVSRVRLGPRTLYVVSSPRLVQEMLVSQANSFTRGFLFEKARPIFGDGLLTSNGEKHLAHRRMMQPLFTAGPIARYVPIIAEIAEARVARWLPEQVLEVHRETHEMAFESVMAVLMRTPLSGGADTRLLDAFPGMVQGILAHATYPWKFLEKVPTRLNRRMRASARTFREILGGVIELRRSKQSDSTDLLGQLLTTPSPRTGEVLTPGEVYDEVVTMVIAGSETVGLTLAWACHELGQRPDIADAVRAEISAAAGSDAITATTLTQLDYTRRVIHETLRLRTPNWMFMRSPVEDAELGGYHLPHGCDIVFSPTTIHRNPHFYPDPYCFDPDRWLPERNTSLPRYAYMPFGAGKTKCIGESLAMAELVVMLGTILRRRQLVPQPGRQVREIPWTTLQPRGLTMVVTAIES